MQDRGPASSAGRAAALPPAAWAVGALMAVLLIARDLMAARGILIPGEGVIGRDFANMWTGGQLLDSGKAALIYDLNRYMQFQEGLFGDIASHNYSYPPPSFFIAWPLAMLPYPVALAIWIGGTAALFFAACKPWLDGRSHRLILLAPACLINIWAGHYGFLVGALFLFGWRLQMAGRWGLAGLCFGSMIVKPHLAVFVPLLLLFLRDWRTIAASAATGAAIVATSIASFGLSPWQDFLFRTSRFQMSLVDAGNSAFGDMSPSLATALMQLDAGMPVALAGHAFLAAGVLAALVFAFQRPAPVGERVLLAATGTILFLPYSFNYDQTAVMVAALVLFHDPRARPGEQLAALAGFLAPTIGMLFARLGVPIMPFMVLALFAAQWRLLMLSSASAGPEPAGLQTAEAAR